MQSTDIAEILQQALENVFRQELPALKPDKENSQPEMLTIEETCNRTNLSRNCVRYYLITQNKIRYIRAGRRYLINWQSVLDYLNTGDGETEGSSQLQEPQEHRAEITDINKTRRTRKNKTLPKVPVSAGANNL